MGASGSPMRSHTPGPGRSQTPALSSASAAAAAHAAHRAHTPASFAYRGSGGGGGNGAPPVPSMPSRYATPAPHGGPPVSPSAGMGLNSGVGLGLGFAGLGSGAMGNAGGMGMGMGMGGGQANNNNNNNPLFRAQTPAPPQLVPPKPRRLSLSGGSPPRSLARSTSEEKAEAFVRWLPPSLNLGGGGGEYDVKRSVSRAGR